MAPARVDPRGLNLTDEKRPLITWRIGTLMGRSGTLCSDSPIHVITYSPSSPHAYQIYDTFIYPVINNQNSKQHLAYTYMKSSSKDALSTVNVHIQLAYTFTQRQKKQLLY